jgi:predicted permease
VSGLRHALRGLRKNPGFTLTALTALSLGIGANTAIFTVVDKVLLQRLPYPDADRIVADGARPDEGGVAEPVFAFWQRNNPGFEDLAAYRSGARMNLSTGDHAELVDTVTASAAYFRLFGARAILGQTFSVEDDRPGARPVLVLSYGLWQTRFGGDPAILGKSIRLGGAEYAVIGVLTPEFVPYPPADVWIPLRADANSTNYAGTLTVAGRLPGAASLVQANARVAALGARWAESRPRLFYRDRFQFYPLQARITGEVRPALVILLGAVGLVLLIACVNVANLLLARSAARQREVAIRAAIGAGRGRIVRQLLTESLLLALGGSALGLVIATWGLRALLAFAPGNLPRVQEIAKTQALDPRIVVFSLLLACMSAIFFGLIPALQLSRTELNAALRESGSRSGGSRGQSRTRGALVASEVALALVLLTGALLLIRSFAALHDVNPGFDPNHVLTAEVSLAGPGYATSSQVDRVSRKLIDRLERVPGVTSAAFASALPLWGSMDMIFNIPGRAPAAGGKVTGDVQWRIVSPHYFDVLRIPLLSGRLFQEHEGRPVAIINEEFARRYWPHANPVGQAIFIGPNLGPAYQVGLSEVVGVVGSERGRLNIELHPFLYQTALQITDGDMALLNGYEPSAVLVRTRMDVAPMRLSQTLEHALQAEQLAAGKIRTMEQLSLDSTERQNFNRWLLGLFAGLAMTLAAVGIYGVMSYSVEQRTQEIGIRAALGANPRDTVGLVLKQALAMVLAGIAAGVAASFGLTRLLAAELFGVKPADPLTFASAPLILIVIAGVAAFLPARRASRVDPLAALRHE